MKPLLLLALLLPLAVGAQVKKCTIEGKTVYSDSLCGQAGRTVNTDANNLDMSAIREHAARVKQQEKADQAEQRSLAKKEEKAQANRKSCGGIIPLGHKPSARQKNEFQRCRDQRMREYNQPSH